jgi:hypothetical protein
MAPEPRKAEVVESPENTSPELPVAPIIPKPTLVVDPVKLARAQAMIDVLDVSRTMDG